MIRKCPVAAQLEIRVRFLYLRDVVAQIFPEQLAIELKKLEPVWLGGFTWHISDASCFAKSSQRYWTIIWSGSPAFAVHPNAINAVVAGQFAELRNKKLVRVWVEKRGCVAVGLAVGVYDAPRGIANDCLGVPH